MKKINLQLIFILFLFGMAGAQSLQNEVVAASGGTFNGTASRLDWTLGEPAVETYTNGATLSQGFHQTFDYATPVYEQPLTKIDIRVYPNPASDWLAIETDAIIPLGATLYDLYGHLLLTSEFNGQTEKLDIAGFPAGTYLLTVSGEAGLVQSFKIQKVRF